MVKQIIRVDEDRDQKETHYCQRCIPSILDPRHSKQPSDFTKVPDFRDTSLILTAPHCHSSALYILSSFFFARKADIVCLLFIVSQTYFNKKTFLLFVNYGFSLFFELLDNLGTHIT